MYFSPRKMKYPSKKQLEIWALKRSKLKGKDIAEQKKVTAGFVSKTLSEANERVRWLLENAARMNKIELDLVNEKLGFARGYNHMIKTNCYITFSPKNDVQVWYEHEGECVSCQKLDSCKKIIHQEFKERGIQVDSPTLRPTDLVEILFRKLEEMVEE